MKAFKSHEEGEEDRDGAMLGAYENDLFDAEKNMRSPLQSPMHSKSPQQQLQQQQFSNRDRHCVPPSRPHPHPLPPRFDKTLGIGTFMGSPSSPSPLKTNARGGGDTEAYYHIDRDDNDDGPKNTTLSKHQQGREAVLRMMSKQKKRASNRSSPHQRSIASPTKIASTAPQKANFSPFTNTFDQRRTF